MYEKYWGLHASPFNETHTAKYFVDNPILKLARTKLRHASAHGQGAAAVMGAPGVGKTCLLNRLVSDLSHEGWALSVTVNPLGDPAQVIHHMARDIDGRGDTPQEALLQGIMEKNRQGRRIALIVDEAHTITRAELFEHLRMLLNLEVNGHLPLTLILCGQEPLLELLKLHSGFDQRLALTCHLNPMDADASKHYILSRLKLAGCTRGIFTRSAAERIVELSQGLPRQINRICELALVVGYGYELKKIRRNVIDTVAADLGFLPEDSDYEAAPSWPRSEEANQQPVSHDSTYIQVPGLRHQPDLARIMADEPFQGDILATTSAPPEARLPAGEYDSPPAVMQSAPPPTPERVVPGEDGPGLFTAMAIDTGNPTEYRAPRPTPAMDSEGRPEIEFPGKMVPEEPPADDDEDILAALTADDPFAKSEASSANDEGDILANL